MRIAVLGAGSQERLWLQSLLAQTSYRKDFIPLAALETPGQPADFANPYDLYLISERAAPPHLLGRLLRELPPASAVLILAADAGPYRALLASSGRRGWGVLPPASPPGQIQAAMGAVLQGLCVFQPAEADQPLPEPLTPREQEIAVLLAQGQANKQIARRLHLSENTVKTHIAAIYGKTGVNNRAELAGLAIRMGWLAV